MQPSKNTYQKTDKSKIIALEKGKIPPQAVDLEEAVLGAMMIDKKGIDDVIDILTPDAFYDSRHQEIFSTIFELYQKSQPIDLLTVANLLKKNAKLDAVGGDFYLIRLTQKVASSSHIEFHSRIILQKYIQRKLISISSEIIENSYDETSDVFDLLDDAEAKLFEVTQGNIKKSSESSGELLKKSLKKIEEISKKKGLSGLATGFKKIDVVTSGWQPSDLIIIAARPGMGKTAMVLSMARNIAIDYNQAVGIFSLEMSSMQLMNRLISIETGLSSNKIRRGELDPDEWEMLNLKTATLVDAPIFIDDTPALSVFDLRAKARRLVSSENIKLIIVDYLQLMTAGNANKNSGNREQEISTISRNLKSLAKELDIPVIALSQLSRAVETRGGNKRPLLSDLRESGAIEQDADIVSFIYRPEYYGIREWDDENHTPCEGQAEFIIAKHRNGGVDRPRLAFTSNTTKFSNLEDDHFVSTRDVLPTAEPEEAFEIDTQFNDEQDDLPF